MISNKLLISGILFFFAQLNFAQSPLKKYIDVTVVNEPFDVALLEVAEAAELSISYNSELVPVDSLISLQIKNSSVKQVLTVMLGEELELKYSGNHLVVLNTFYAENEKRAKKSITIDGYITDTEGKAVINAAVFDVKKLKSTITDDKGYFSLEMDLKEEYVGISVINPGFEDFTTVLSAESQAINLSLNKTSSLGLKTDSMITGVDGSEILLFDKIITNEGTRVRGQRPTYINRDFQISFLPFLGTNFKMSGIVENRYSLNLISGYNGSINGFEAGGVLNITRNYMHGVQLSGIWNIVGRETSGFQAAGVLNTNLGDVDGVSIAGTANIGFGTHSGIQIAGVANMGLEVNGTQMAGVMNLIYRGNSKAQIAGMFNYAVTSEIAQVSGLLNVVKDSLKGVQAGLLNYGAKNNGLQFGLINISEDAGGGTFGIINIVRKGYNKIELSYIPKRLLNAKAKFGTYWLYNIIGYLHSDFSPLVQFGLGTNFGNRNKSSFYVDLLAYEPIGDDLFSRRSITLGHSIKIHKRFSFFGGLSMNRLKYPLNEPIRRSNDHIIIPISDNVNSTQGKVFFMAFEAGFRLF